MRNGSLLERMRCPRHPQAGPLKQQPAGGPTSARNSELLCPQCGAVYPILHGIPDMVNRERLQGTFLETESEQSDRCAEQYDQKRTRDPAYMATVEAEVEALQVRGGDFVLDAGCGTGLTVRRYAAAGVRVVGLDLSMQSLLYLRKTLPQRACVDLVRAELTALPFEDQTFTKVLCANAIQHLPAESIRQDCIQELARVAQPLARVVVSTHNYSIPKKRAGWAKEGSAQGSAYGDAHAYLFRFASDELRTLLSSALVVERIRGAGLPLPYKYKLSPFSRRLERLLRRFAASAHWGYMLIGVGHTPPVAPGPASAEPVIAKRVSAGMANL